MTHEVIERYIRAEFGGPSEITTTAAGALKVRIQKDDGVFAAEFAREFLDEHTPDEIDARLREWNLAEEMRRMEGLEVSVSNAGVRLDSSN